MQNPVSMAGFCFNGAAEPVTEAEVQGEMN